ncbi:MAG: alpha-glucosidase C-terminal domain-containing protein [Muribaculaceae bacterium]|nr:alpha-glucosidase C-terminal domain-containing protein [Muribaculaceae bacterium]
MKGFKLCSLLLVLAAGLVGCKSNGIDEPDTPTPPVVGQEVKKDVVYQANPRFFGENECLKALEAQLPRISNMGCNILWIMPIQTPGELKAIGSPYCIRDYYGINPRYGTMNDLRSLVDKAHAAGMVLILDWVANHTSWDNPWITEHPDWYQHDANGNIMSPMTWTDVAQLDYSKPAVRQAMKDAMLWWVKEAGIDGYRCDYVEGIDHDFWKDINSSLKAAYPDILMLAETGNPAYYADGFDMVYDWNSSSAIMKAFTGGRPSNVVTEASDALAEVPEGKSRLRYIFNHDVAAENDAASSIGSRDALPAAYVLASMFGGTPMIYSSMDVENLSGKLSFFDYKPLVFSNTLSAEYKAINDAFKATADVRVGTIGNYSTASIVCFSRKAADHTLLVAVNTTAEAQSMKMPITVAGFSVTEMITGNEFTAPVTLDLQPYGYTILLTQK